MTTISLYCLKHVITCNVTGPSLRYHLWSLTDADYISTVAGCLP